MRGGPVVPVIVLVVLGVVGCVSSRETGKPFPASARYKLAIDRTTKLEAQKLLGPAAATTAGPDGREQWTYEHTRVWARRLNPFSRSVEVRQSPYEQLVLTFDKGILRECTFLAETYRTEDGVILPAERVQEPCGR